MARRSGFSESICRIYDSAIQEDSWVSALDASVHYIGAKSSAIMVADTESELPYVLSALSAEFGRLGDGAAEYVRLHSHHELEAYVYMQQNPHQRIYDDTDVWPDVDHPLARPDYRYLYEKMGVFRRLCCRLNDNSRWFDCLTYQFDGRHQRIPKDSYRLMSELVPHMGKALELARINHILEAKYKAVLAALDHVEFGICICNERGDVIVKNHEADRILRTNDGLSQNPAGHLRCQSLMQSAELARAIADLATTASGLNDASVHTMRVQKRGSESSYIVEVTALRDSRAEIETGLSGAMVMLLDSEKSFDIDYELFARVNELTATESKVCRLMIEGHTNSEIADIRGVAESTVKSQTRAVLQKTRTGSRIELMRLAIQTSPPVS